MIKVVIIDDEPLVRLGLKSMLQWEELGYEIVGEAANGQQGLELIMEQQPEIVITDIKMPVMDGLVMMRLAFEKQPRLKFIILSSYDQFNLVKQAMKQGAEEYLIKLDLHPESLIAALTEVREKLITQRGSSGSTAFLDQGLRENITMLREGFLKRLVIKSPQSEAEINQQLEYLGIELEAVLGCALIRFVDLEELKKYEAQEIGTLEMAVLNTIDEIVNDVFKGYTVMWEQGQFMVILSGGPETTRDEYLRQAVSLGGRLVQIVKQYFNISIAVGFGNPCQGYGNLRESYCEALRAIQYCLYSATQSVLCFDELATDANQVQIDITAQKSLLPQALELGDQKKIAAIFKTFGAIISDPQVTREQAYDLCLQIAYLISGAPGINEIDLNEIFGCQNSLYESILTLVTMAQLHKWLVGLERNIFNWLSRNDEQKNHRLVAKAKKYILDHYQEEISLNEVAAFINLSPGYLSTIFHQKTGICFTDYVTEVKIAQAKKLIQESEYKVYEIAAMLGYQNAYYFSKVFKKVTGMTPSEYSEKNIECDSKIL